jgi:AcrR family transcriptional regulator
MGTEFMTARGPKAQRGEIAHRILDQARESFAEHGYAATTLQGIARSAGVDTKLVRYYFTSKETLFAECLAAAPGHLVERVRAVAAQPSAERGEALVRIHLAAWSDPQLARILRTALQVAAQEPVAMAKVRAVFVDSLAPVTGDRARCAGLISAYLLGLAFGRFVFAIDQVAEIPDEQVVRSIGATIQRHLDEPL